VTIHQTVKELDAGPIAAKQVFPIGRDDDAGVVYTSAAEIAAELLDPLLDESVGQLKFEAQPTEGVTYADKITAADRTLDVSRAAEELVRQVRALSPHIGARAELHGRRVTVWRARVDEAGAFEPLEVQPEGGRPMAYDAWLRGLR
jgi:methionyl-tRNA formyltransferase